MKKFILLAHGDVDRTPEFRQAQQKWWSAMEGHVVDSGNPLFNGLDVTKDGQVSEIAADASPVLGYSLIEAESTEAALALLADCPMDMWIYEAMPM